MRAKIVIMNKNKAAQVINQALTRLHTFTDGERSLQLALNANPAKQIRKMEVETGLCLKYEWERE